MNMSAVQETPLSPSTGSIIEQYVHGLRAFTFWVSDTLYAVDIARVLTISQEMKNIQTLPAQAKGLVGMVEFQDTAVPVLDFANMLGFSSGMENNLELIELLNNREKDHIDWIASLEDSLIHDTPFLQVKDPHKCQFGQWHDSFTTRDETLSDVLAEFNKPHEKIHALADTLFEMKKNNNIESVIKKLNFEKEVTLKQLSKRFEQARTHLRESTRQVLLYITEDGVNPTVALRIDDINDVIDFKTHQFKSIERIGSLLNSQASNLIIAYLKQEKQADSLLIDASQLINVAQNT